MASPETEKKKSVLGRGLASLIPDAGSSSNSPPKNFFFCDIEKIVPNTYQPRKIFDKDALEELSSSIKVHGIIQPLIVRKNRGNFELIAGERRWRAAQKAGLKQVPVVIKDVSGDGTALELAIIENIQREELNCIEEAIAYQQLVDEFQLSQEDIAKRVGKNRSTITNIIRLLKLPSVIREDISANKLSMGHARALLSLEDSADQIKARDEIIKGKLSVRETERLVKGILKENKTDSGSEVKQRDPNIAALEDNLRRHFGSKVRICGDKKGFVQFIFSNTEDLTRLSEKLLSADK